MAALTGCAPGLNSVVAIGVDGPGHLIGAIKVCDHSVAQASLSPVLPEGQRATATYWDRSQALDRPEVWRLDAPTSGKWKRDGAIPAFTPGGLYGFEAHADNRGYQSQLLQFTGSQLAQLSPNQFLVSTKGAGAKVIPLCQPCLRHLQRY
jgi:hypothetical protein